MFVSLPISFGKSLCYILLPNLFDVLRGVDTCGNSIILVVLPLEIGLDEAYCIKKWYV